MCIPTLARPLSLFLFLCLAQGTVGQAQEVSAGKHDYTPGELRSYSTLHSIGVEWDLEGDADHDAVCRVQYRAEGEAPWREALPLFRVDYFGWYGDTKADRAYNMLAGSVLFLKPGTGYEVKLDLSDPDGTQDSRVLAVKTRPVPSLPNSARAFHVVPGNGGGDGSAAEPFQGLAAAQAKAEPGDIFLLHAGGYGKFTFDRSGAPGRYLAWKSDGDGDAIFEQVAIPATHVWIEGMTFHRAGQANGLVGMGTAADIVVSRNRFTGFHYSILARRECRDWYIADNTIVGDNDPVKGGISGEGIELTYSSGHTVAHNSITQTADGVSYPGRNCDIFGNDIFDVSDDGLEPDYGYANNRMWGNRLTNCHFSALSFQPMYCGPWYFIRNQIISSHIFKFRVQDRFLLAHNTIVCWGSMDGQMAHVLTGMTRNNLFISAANDQPVWTARRPRGPTPYSLPPKFEPTWKTDIDYDGFDWGDSPEAFRWDERQFPDLERFAAAVGIERHGRHVRREEIFQRWQVPTEPSPVPLHHLSLAPKTSAIDAGVVLPNIKDDFSGQAPDLGALEYGKPLPQYGPR